MRAGLCALLFSFFAGGEASAAETPADMQLFLLIGQSNMAGRGIVEPADQEIHPRIFMLDKTNVWVPAKDPVHFDKPKVAGVGLCSEFARRVADRNPGANIGLIPCAFGGTTLDQWKPGSDLYTNAVARTRAALNNGRLAGILWHQGEGDCATQRRDTYPARFSEMIAQLRQDVGAEQAPVVIGELGWFNDSTKKFNAMLPQVVAAVPRCALASAEGLGANSDNVHFSRAALVEFGKRYFEAFTRTAK